MYNYGLPLGFLFKKARKRYIASFGMFKAAIYITSVSEFLFKVNLANLFYQ